MATQYLLVAPFIFPTGPAPVAAPFMVQSSGCSATHTALRSSAVAIGDLGEGVGNARVASPAYSPLLAFGFAAPGRLQVGSFDVIAIEPRLS
jgi:hypothetical protein